ncbi:MAG: enoyl-CoA hydratase/isomerase family protein [Balneolaceae bacterium]
MPLRGDVTHTIKNNISTVEFHHPKGNSLPGLLLGKLANAIEEAVKSPDSRVIVLRSAGDGAFCAGASFDELLAIENLEQGKTFFMGFANVINAMRKSSKFILTRVHGRAVGGGVGLIAASDYAFAHVDASVKLSELAVGSGPFVVGPAVGRKMGVGSFTAMSLDARNWYSAGWAKSKALFARVYPTLEELDEAIDGLAKDLASSNPEAMAELRKLQWQGTGHWESTLEQRAELSGRLVLSDFTRNYIKEFQKSH